MYTKDKSCLALMLKLFELLSCFENKTKRVSAAGIGNPRMHYRFAPTLFSLNWEGNNKLHQSTEDRNKRDRRIE